MTAPTIATRFSTPNPTLCTVCRRRAVALAHLTKRSGQPLWLCDSPDCHRLAPEVAKMPLDQLDVLERAASEEAFGQACDYLDGLRKTDLAKATTQELAEFQRLYLTGYEKLLRQKIETGGLPY